MPVDNVARSIPHFIYDTETQCVTPMSRKNIPVPSDTRSGILSPVIMDALKNHEPNMKTFEIFNEVVLRDNCRIRASPNYANSGPWYDFANVSWERVDNNVTETYLLPAKCLCFFHKHCPDTGLKEIMALIHTVDESSGGKCPGRPDTLLLKNYRMQYNQRRQPITYVVPVASVDSCIRCFPHSPTKELFHPDSPWISCLLSRNHWSYMWLAMNHVVQECNSIEKIKQRKGKLIALSNNHLLGMVRERYQRIINDTGLEDLS